jgi:hypothetical protein
MHRSCAPQRCMRPLICLLSASLSTPFRLRDFHPKVVFPHGFSSPKYIYLARSFSCMCHQPITRLPRLKTKPNTSLPRSLLEMFAKSSITALLSMALTIQGAIATRCAIVGPGNAFCRSHPDPSASIVKTLSIGEVSDYTCRWPYGVSVNGDA